ncbi:hypothetical protein ACPXCE_15460 [Streptomyces sp. DT24]|uniref:hypothetical protein n=1 Tax=Streptomyces sp. DT24 TaxID=3416520 RepID=UPI003CE67ECB
MLIAVHYFRPGGFLLAAVDPDSRKDIYSSLTGSSSGLLGFALAAVAIMAAFGRRSGESQEIRERENNLADARVGISKVLLVTSILLMVLLVAATVAIGADRGKVGNFSLTSIVVSSAVSSLIGLLVSGAGLTLSLMERSRNP